MLRISNSFKQLIHKWFLEKVAQIINYTTFGLRIKYNIYVLIAGDYYWQHFNCKLYLLQLTGVQLIRQKQHVCFLDGFG